MITRLFKGIILALTLTLPTAAIAGGCVEDYDTNSVTFVENGRTYITQRITSFGIKITERDLYNSRGIRLTSAGAVIQQAVANHLKTGAPLMGGNTYFDSLERRSLLSTSPLYLDCVSLPSGNNLDFDYESALMEIRYNIVHARVKGAALGVLGFRHPSGGIVFQVGPIG